VTKDTKKSPVTIYFSDENISALFCALLSARGIPTRTTVNRQALTTSSTVITEARFFELLDTKQKNNSLVVGNKLSLATITEQGTTLVLIQPLTENKVERAIDEFVMRWESVQAA